MHHDRADSPSTAPLPSLARRLGYAGLLPQAAALVAVLIGGLEWRFTALALAFAYAALILSFLGGIWWGMAALRPAHAPNWVWFAAIAPSLIALATTVPWAIGAAWPGPSLVILSLALFASLAVDHRLERIEIAPPGWTAFRFRLSGALGFLTLAIAIL